MHVVSAGVADAGNGRAVGDVLLVVERQRVEVGAEHHRRAGVGAARVADVVAPDVAPQPRADRRAAAA